jgi:ubiquinol-cytochrome c reductase cytochrome c1 subunit
LKTSTSEYLNMKKIILTLVAALSMVGSVHAASEGVAWDPFPTDKLTDQASLQNGAKLFVNHCMNCHGASFVRYNRLQEIGLTDAQIKDNLIFDKGVKVGDTMKTTLDPKSGKEWFGAAPPDLSLVARSRAAAGKGTGADYLYTYLRSYYRDPSKATGWDNLAFPSVAMPNVLWELQGERRPVYDHRPDPHNSSKQLAVFKGWESVKAGTLSAREFDSQVGDLVAFMTWMAEPQAKSRVRIGIWALLGLLVFALAAWRLNAAYWKDVK